MHTERANNCPKTEKMAGLFFCLLGFCLFCFFCASVTLEADTVTWVHLRKVAEFPLWLVPVQSDDRSLQNPGQRNASWVT